MNDVHMERVSCSPWRTCHPREAELWIWSILLVYKLKNWYRYLFLDNTSQAKCISVYDKCAVSKWVKHASRREYIGNRAQETEMTLRWCVTCIILHSIWCRTALEANPDEH